MIAEILAYLKQVFCPHSNQTFIRNVYGDEILERGCRSIWKCDRCGKIVQDPSLHL